MESGNGGGGMRYVRNDAPTWVTPAWSLEPLNGEPSIPAPAREQSAPANDNAPARERYTDGNSGQPYTNDNRLGDWISTYTGRQAYPMDLRPEEIHIADISHSLAMQCRYT